MEEKVYFNSDGLKLCGILNRQETDKCIILCHGITVDKEEDGIFTNLSEKLAQKGYAVFRFDFRAHGESEGDSKNLTITGEKKDLEAAYALLQKQGYKQFGILAASFAGGAASLFAAEHPEIKALVLWNALVDYDSALNPTLSWPRKNFGPEAQKKLETQGYMEIGSSKYKVGPKLIEEMRQIKPWQELKKTKIPMLFVHGDKDTYIPYEDSVKYAKMLKAKIEIIKDAEHGFHDNKKQEKQADKATIQFFTQNL
ncbi:lysophospholipase [Candidatus Woesearchaeota archaeon]|nr:lysophospholipase [Candidatus Woesearchaeota archaeon]MBW3016264.1 lysophospholipase [Candidatus Woesearchaeota archaeon]